jgi:hypothetical protein
MTSFKAKDANISVARMVNAAGSVVLPTQAAVQAAMAYFRPVIDQGALCPGPDRRHRQAVMLVLTSV